MRFLLYLSLLLFPAFSSFGQTIVCDTGGFVFNNFMRVTAPSGVNLRAAPASNAAKLLTIPNGTELPVAGDDHLALPYETIEGKHSQWRRAVYAGKTGCVFGGFMEELDENTAVQFKIPNAGNESNNENLHLNPQKQWFALAPVPTKKPEHQSDYALLQSVPVQLEKTLIPGHDAEQFRPSRAPDNTRIYFGGFKPGPKAESYYCPENPEMLYPGQVRSFYTFDNSVKRQHHYQVYATGQPVPNKDSQGFWPFVNIRNYALYVREVEEERTPAGQGFKVVSEQLLFKGNLHFGFHAGKYEDGPEIFMAGDFDHDKRLDLILFWSGSNYHVFYLFLSSKALPGFMMRVVAKVTDSCC